MHPWNFLGSLDPRASEAMIKPQSADSQLSLVLCNSPPARLISALSKPGLERFHVSKDTQLEKDTFLGVKPRMLWKSVAIKF